MNRVGFLVLVIVSVWVGTEAGETPVPGSCISCAVRMDSTSVASATATLAVAGDTYDAGGAQGTYTAPMCDADPQVAVCTGTAGADQVCGMLEYDQAATSTDGDSVTTVVTSKTAIFGCLEDFSIPARAKRNTGPAISRAKRTTPTTEAECITAEEGKGVSTEAATSYCKCGFTIADFETPICTIVATDTTNGDTNCGITCGLGMPSELSPFHAAACLDLQVTSEAAGLDDGTVAGAILTALLAGNVVGAFAVEQEDTTEFADDKVVTFEVYGAAQYPEVISDEVNTVMTTFVGANAYALDHLYRTCDATALVGTGDPVTTTAAPTTAGSDGSGSGAAGIRNLFIVNIAAIFGYMMLA